MDIHKNIMHNRNEDWRGQETTNFAFWDSRVDHPRDPLGWCTVFLSSLTFDQRLEALLTLFLATMYVKMIKKHSYWLPCCSVKASRWGCPLASISSICDMTTERPQPGTVLNWATRPVISSSFKASLTNPTMALASGCSEPFSAAARILNSRLADKSEPIRPKYDTVGRPWVMVPVLSKTTVCVLWAVSRGSAP